MKREQLEKLKNEGTIYQEVDGFYVWGGGSGSLSGANLREIADYLEELNRDWAQHIRMDLGSQELGKLTLHFTAQLDGKSLIDFKTLKLEYNGDLLEYLKQLEEEDGNLLSIVDTTPLIQRVEEEVEELA